MNFLQKNNVPIILHIEDIIFVESKFVGWFIFSSNSSKRLKPIEKRDTFRITKANLSKN